MAAPLSHHPGLLAAERPIHVAVYRFGGILGPDFILPGALILLRALLVAIHTVSAFGDRALVQEVEVALRSTPCTDR